MVFINASEDSVMVDDVVMFSNPPLTLVKEEELEETLLDVNVSQWSCDEESFERVVRTQVNRSTWDCRLSPNPHALAIYLKFILARGAAAKKV